MTAGDRQMATDSSLPAISAAAIEAALGRDEMQLVYQPQVDAAHGALVGFEALLRWNSPSLGEVSPATFIPVAEQSTAIEGIWDFILARVADDRSALAARPELHVAMNLSAAQLPRPGLGAEFERWLEISAIDSSQVHLEITESSLLQHGPALFDNLRQLRELGVSIWLDDFGTGFSSLRHLRDLPISGLKIDQSFVAGLEDNLDDFRIVSAIVAMSNSLGLLVVAEGVETSGQAQMLTQLGCDVLQGYLIGRPAPLEELILRWSKSGPPPGASTS